MVVLLVMYLVPIVAKVEFIYNGAAPMCNISILPKSKVTSRMKEIGQMYANNILNEEFLSFQMPCKVQFFYCFQ